MMAIRNSLALCALLVVAAVGCNSNNNNSTIDGGVTGCTTNADCASTPTLSVCSPITHGCAACDESQNTDSGTNPTCPAAELCIGIQCSACDPSQNDPDTDANPACSGSTPTCSTTGAGCVQCIDDMDCAAGTCGDDGTCSGGGGSAALSTVCVGTTDGATCPNEANGNEGGYIGVAAQLTGAAPSDTMVTLTLTAGNGSFALGSSVITKTTTITAGNTNSVLVPVYLDKTDTTSITVNASIGDGNDQTGTIDPVAATATTVMALRVDGVAVDGVTPAKLSSAGAVLTFEQHNMTVDATPTTIAVPATVNATGNTALTVAGSSSSEGTLTLSPDGRFIAFAGYEAVPGTLTVSTGTNRVIGLLDGTGAINTTTRLTTAATDYSGGSIRGAVTTDGTALWVAGSVDGVVTTTVGTNAGTLVSTGAPTNLRAVEIAGGQLYVTSASGAFDGVSSVGTGLPTASGQAIAIVPGFPIATGATISPETFVAFDTDGTDGIDTIYLAQNPNASPATGLTVEKWTLGAGGTWAKDTNFIPALVLGDTAIGVTGTIEGGKVRIVATTFNKNIDTFIDDGTETPAVTILNPTTPIGADSAYRGIAISPVQ